VKNVVRRKMERMLLRLSENILIVDWRCSVKSSEVLVMRVMLVMIFYFHRTEEMDRYKISSCISMGKDSSGRELVTLPTISEGDFTDTCLRSMGTPESISN
jgi:hypothetical protein